MSPELQTWIEEQKPELVEAAERYVERSKIFLPPEADPRRGGRPDKNARVSGSQLRNLLNVALTERSLAVLRNFLRYQVGRQWKDGKAGAALEELLAREIAERTASRMDAATGERREVEAALLPLLLGFVIREYTYQCRRHGTRSDG
jgi:hypothetical protein